MPPKKQTLTAAQIRRIGEELRQAGDSLVDLAAAMDDTNLLSATGYASELARGINWAHKLAGDVSGQVSSHRLATELSRDESTRPKRKRAKK